MKLRRGEQNGVEVEVMFSCHVQHAKVDEPIFMAGEADEADFAGFARIEKSLDRAAGRKETIGIFHANHLMELELIDVAGLEPLERFIELLRGGLFSAAIRFRYQENRLAVTVVLVPGVVHEVNAAVDGGADDLRRERIGSGFSDMRTADTQHGNGLAGLAETAVERIAASCFLRPWQLFTARNHTCRLTRAVSVRPGGRRCFA
jgi:hypothetical protein